MSNNSGPLLALFLGTAIIALFYFMNRRRWSERTKGLSLPPGPPTNPVFGNLLHFPPTNTWLKLTEYKQQYGDIVSFHGLGQTIISLNSLEAINDLFDKRGAIYCDRPRLIFGGELVGAGQLLAMNSCGPQWRAHRKLAHAAFNGAAVKKYHGTLEDIAALLNRALLDSPQDYYAHVRLTSGRIMQGITYGISVRDADEKYIGEAEEVHALLAKAGIPGTYLVDIFPFLKHAPSWVSFQKEARNGRIHFNNMINLPFEYVKEQMAAGVAPSSMTYDLLLAEDDGDQDHERNVKLATGSVYLAAVETTFSTVTAFMMMMALNPDVQKKVQDELDDVVGVSRLPLLADRPYLPYLAAVIKESMRYHPVVPLSLPRRVAQDDVYKGYFIPKDTIVFSNSWAVAYEPNEKYDPHKFLPDRFLDKTQNVVDPHSYYFGYGRRICPGQALAEDAIFILVTSIFFAFEISVPVGGVITPAYGINLVSKPERFDCQIKPRSQAKENIVQLRAAQTNV